jgi:CBS domain-containing protein
MTTGPAGPGPSALWFVAVQAQPLAMSESRLSTKSLPHHRTVSDVMTRQVHVAGPQAPFKQLVRLIEENRVSSIPIVDQQGVPIGIVSESDLLLDENHLKGPKDSIASKFMTSPVFTVAAHASRNQAARLMRARNVRRLVVVDERGRIAGIVSRSDLLGLLS